MDTKGVKGLQVIESDAMADTTIPIDSDVRDRLRAQKVGNETYSDVIERLIEDNDS